MITEDFCSFELAKQLKEKGFTEPCYRWYDDKGTVSAKFINPDIPLDYASRDNYLCPTHQMAMKWLRNKQIYIRIVEDVFGKSFRFEIYSKNPNIKINYYVSECYEDTYEDAVEAALKYYVENMI